MGFGVERCEGFLVVAVLGIGCGWMDFFTLFIDEMSLQGGIQRKAAPQEVRYVVLPARLQKYYHCLTWWHLIRDALTESEDGFYVLQSYFDFVRRVLMSFLFECLL